METRARYALVGLFTLFAIAAGFAFVYWLHNTGGLGERDAYRIKFADAVLGLRSGSAVLFNGIRVGEVTDLRLSAENPREVTATVLVERNTPIRADTQVSVDVQGLMGAPAISLRGGAPGAAALSGSQAAPPLLVADAAAGQDTMQTARAVLRRIDAILVENAEPLRNTLASLDTFTAALARNSGRLDGIIEGLERLTGGGPAKAPPAVFDLTAPTRFPPIEPVPAGQLAVADPTAVIALDSQRIFIRSGDGESSPLPDGQWSDNLPKLVQARVIQSLENAGYLKVGRASETFAADHQLAIDIRTFRIVTSPQAVAEIELGLKLLAADGRVLDARVLRATAPADVKDVRSAVAGLNTAFGEIVMELVPWTLKAL